MKRCQVFCLITRRILFVFFFTRKDDVLPKKKRYFSREWISWTTTNSLRKILSNEISYKNILPWSQNKTASLNNKYSWKKLLGNWSDVVYRNRALAMQKPAASKILAARHMERYPVSSSDLLSSNSNSDVDIRDLNDRNYQTSHSNFERFDQMPTISTEFIRRPGDTTNRPYSMIMPRCTKIRTNPKYRYSYSNGQSKLDMDSRRSNRHDANSDDDSSESPCSFVRRHSQRIRRRLKLRNQLR